MQLISGPDSKLGSPDSNGPSFAGFDEDPELDSIMNYLAFSGDEMPELLPLRSTLSGSFDLPGSSPFDLPTSSPAAEVHEDFSGDISLDRAARSMQPTKIEDEDLSGDEQHDEHQSGKRRRRLRSAKQQELNRLAQQRYRQRKREKYTNLQSTVDLLAQKIHELNLLEKEALSLRATRHHLEEKLLAAQATTREVQQELEKKDQLVAKTNQQLAQAARMLQTQQSTIKEYEQAQKQAQQAKALEEQVLKCPAGDQPESVANIVSCVLADLANQGLIQGSPEALAPHIHRSLDRCRELCTLKQQAEQASTAIPVSCC